MPIKLREKFNARQLVGYCGVFGIAFIVSCKNNNVQLSTAESAMVKDSVSHMAANISADVSKKGPAAWIDYFENAPGFSMASGGMLVFSDYATAKTYTLNTVVKNFKTITLTWKNLRVDPLTSAFANLGADFHEDIVMANGQNLSAGGYFTATAHFDGTKWRLRTMNWAIKAPEK